MALASARRNPAPVASRVGLGSTVALTLLAFAYTPTRANDAFFPTFGNPGIDVRHYAIRLDVEGKGRRLAGTAVLTIEATRRLEEFELDLSHLGVNLVEIDGVTAQFRQSPGKLTIRPARAITKGDTFRPLVRYAGVPRTTPDPTAEDPSSIPGLGWSKWAKGSYVVGEPVGAGTWYPVNDVPTDKASYRFTVLADEPLSAVAN